MIQEQDRANVIKRINREELAELTKQLVDISSPRRSANLFWPGMPATILNLCGRSSVRIV